MAGELRKASEHLRKEAERLEGLAREYTEERIAESMARLPVEEAL